MTALPSNGDYVEALQHPATCFHDQDLKAGQVQLTPLGMPKAISGNFASVFSVTGASGKRYAVKCFTRQVHGQHQRYQAIHDTLAALAKPWQVGFEYISQGVLVNGHWHAILRMEWVENSQTLIPWVEQNLGNPGLILDVAKQFASCIGDMRDSGIAHGDLQHGNLLIDTDHRLRLIDYDGMFVPSIKNLGSSELGLENYQHPCRSNTDFGSHLDRFSSWLIYSSLLALAAHPGLWTTLRKDGDEKLLFGKEDFVAPFTTIKRIATLGSPHTEISSVLTDLLASAATLEEIPDFDPARLPAPADTPTSPTMTVSSDWWRQISANSASTDSVANNSQTVQAARLGTSWLRTHEAPLPPVKIVGPSKATKVMALTITMIVLLGAITVGVANPLIGGLVMLTWAAAMAAGAGLQWHRSETRVDRTDALRGFRQAGRIVAQKQKQLAAARSVRASLDGKETKEIHVLEKERSKLGKASSGEYERLSKDLRKKVESYRAELTRVDGSRMNEARLQLKRLQDVHIQKYLAARRIEPGVISGIGPSLVAALGIHGIRTAADISAINGPQFRRTGSSTWFTVHGIGPTKASSIKYWHQRQHAAAQTDAPKSLPQHETQAIDAKYANQKAQYQAAIDAAESQMRQIKAATDAKYAGLEQEISLKIEAVRLEYQHKRAADDAMIAQMSAELQHSEDILLDAERNLARFKSVTFSNFLRS
ncbi:lipopolysaccharide kinase InaA family protein [Mycolicibacterium smegmatis]|uniref:Protein kinase domain protein n=1 Tax=Mycolicibacterium smegmatis (strain MKD8) TaxID=1214915 RepID=A0A2U9PKH6_MYCSE|nr:lipopolysaccharide kinase InaA family protein [Mycolicibacterium smegmatis]AWT52254.1 Protein kinase domain protein [Mycolicibacterium smegmatis MKD8]